MSLYKNRYRNESARLAGGDYSSPGYYFVTVCTHNRVHVFGEIDNGVMVLNEYGAIVWGEWEKSFAIRRELVRDAFVIMPNHFHGIVKITGTPGPVGTHGRASPYRVPKSVSSFMAGVKSAITKRVNQTRNTAGARIV
jgi:hypothetical protein